MSVEKFPPKTALFIGAGAVERAWDPIVAALQHFTSVKINADQASCMITRSVFLSRFFSTCCGSDGSRVEFDLLEKKKKKIAEELKNAQEVGLIRARKEIEWVVSHLLLPRSPVFYVVSTNWDHTVDTAIDRLLSNYPGTRTRVFHLHGSYTDPSTLYFPSEISSESYRKFCQNQEIGVSHVGLMDRLGELEHLVLYGISLDPLDAELSQTLSTIIDSPKLKSIDILDLQPDKVASRVALLMKNPRLPSIKCIRPIDIPIR